MALPLAERWAGAADNCTALEVSGRVDSSGAEPLRTSDGSR